MDLELPISAAVLYAERRLRLFHDSFAAGRFYLTIPAAKLYTRSIYGEWSLAAWGGSAHKPGPSWQERTPKEKR